MDTVTFTINFPGLDPIQREVPLDVAQAWMRSRGVEDPNAAIESVLNPIVRAGCEALANERTQSILAGK